MPLIRRRLRQLPLQFPQLDGSTWPDRHAVGRTSFAAVTLYEMAYREAFAPESHDVADLLLGQVLPLLPTHEPAEDEPYLRRVLSSAAQIGAGIGIVERRVVRPDELYTDRQIAGALWVAADDLPSMPGHRQDVARYLLQCGYYLARTGPAQTRRLVEALGHENQA